MVWTRERLAASTDHTQEAQEAAQRMWDEFREWLVKPPADEDEFMALVGGSRLGRPRSGFSSTEATAAAAYIAAREAERGG